MESNQVNLEQLWASPRVEQGDISKVYQSIDTYRLKKVKMNWALAIIGVTTIGWIIGIYIWLLETEFSGNLWVILGSLCCVIAMMLFMFNYYRLNSLMPESILTQSTSDYIALLTKEKKQQLQLSKVWMNVYIVTLIMGIAIFTYPFIAKFDSELIAVIYYIGIFIWAGINLYWNRKANAKRISQLKEMINQLQKIE